MSNSSENDDFDFSFFKDMSDIVRGRIALFLPFFGAYLAFVLSKNDYVLSAIWPIKLWLAFVFFLGAFYASTAADALWAIENIKLMLSMNKASSGEIMKAASDTEKSAIVSVGTTIPKILSFEAKLFRWVMRVLYFTGGTAIISILFESTISSATRLLIGKLLN